MEESNTAAILLLNLGLVLLLGLTTDALGRFTRLPRVTLMMLFGILIGPFGLSIIPQNAQTVFPIVAKIALVMVGFLLGERFTLSRLKEYGNDLIKMSLVIVIITATVVFTGLLLLGISAHLALLLAAISSATAPAATMDVVNESGSNGKFENLLLGIVAIDDAWGLILFSVLFSLVQGLNGNTEPAIFATLIRDLGGAALIGIFMGIPMALLSGRIKKGEPTIIEALGFVSLCGGLALWFEVSFILASMVLGAVVANLAKHHERPFHAIEQIEQPFMLLFFILAGVSLDFSAIKAIGILGIGYITFRIIGRVLGGILGARVTQPPRVNGTQMGIALLPQAGVAIGMALVVAEKLPPLGQVVLPVIVGATIFFEIIGPVCTRYILKRNPNNS